MWNLKKMIQMKLFTKQQQTLTYGCQRGKMEGGINQESEINIYIVLYI